MINFEIINSIIFNQLAEKVVSAERFPTGNCHFVFDVTTESGNCFVLRIARPENKQLLENLIYWTKFLKSANIPLPKIVAANLETNYPFLILERLPGKDLWEVYKTLSSLEKRNLAFELNNLQEIVGNFPKAKHFGFLDSYNVKSGCKEWSEVVLSNLARSRRRIENSIFFDTKLVDRVEKKMPQYENYFAEIKAIPFFDDITTKNVIVNNGKLSGIVDVDWLCFGDRIFTVALTQTSLLIENCDVDYINYWCDAMKLNELQRKVLNFYSAVFCVDLMSEIGQKFNKEVPLTADNKKIERFFQVFDFLLEIV